MAYSILTELVEHALDATADGHRISATHQPDLSSPSTALDASFSSVRIDSNQTGLAYARLSCNQDTQQSVNTAHAVSPGQSASRAIASLPSRPTSQRDLPMAAMNAALLHANIRQLHAASEPVDTLVPFEKNQEIGMVGYFSPLIPVLVAAGHQVRVVELDTTSWQQQPGVSVSGDSRQLANCDTVLCTATVLLNDTFESIRSAASSCSRFVLLGPTTPLAPGVMARHGVTHLASRTVTDQSGFWSACAQGLDWSQYTRKYVLET